MSVIVSPEDSATHRAFLRDVFGRILDGEDLKPQTLMQAYTSVFTLVHWSLAFFTLINWMKLKVQITNGPNACVEVYSFVRDSLSEYIFQKVNEAEARDVPKLALTIGAMTTIDGVCRYLQRAYLAKQGLEAISAFALHTFREAAVEKIQSVPQLLSDWLQGAIDGVRQGTKPSEEVKSYGRNLLDIFEISPDDYATRVSMPFIRDAVALYHEKAKELAPHYDFEARKTEILEVETHRAEVYLHEPHRSDYVATIGELFRLGDEKFQRP